MGRCPISKMIFVDLQVIFLRFAQVFSYSISHESVTSDVESSLIPYLGLPVPPAPPSVALIKICEAGLVLSVTHILRAALSKFRVYVCACNYSFQTTEPICIKIIPANRASYADFYRLLRFEIFTPTIFITPKTHFWGPRNVKRSRRWNCITMPNFIEIARNAAEICEFQYYASLA